MIRWDMPVKHYFNEEVEYAEWLLGHPNGFVFNHFRTRDAAYNIMHRASCEFLRRPGDLGQRTRIEKICSDDLDRLLPVVNGLRADAGGWRWCESCFRQKASGSLEPRIHDSSRRISSAGSPSAAQSPSGWSDHSVPPAITDQVFTLWRPTKLLESVEIEPRLASSQLGIWWRPA